MLKKPVMDALSFLQQLQDAVHRLQKTVETELRPLNSDALNHKPSPTSWSALECLEHLNRYSRYYNHALNKALQQRSSIQKYTGTVEYSWLGRKSLEIARPDNGKRHKTVKHMNPAGSRLSRGVLDEFLQHQTQLLTLMTQAATVNLNKKAIPVEFLRLLKLRIGEALEFMVLHQQRHVQQALRAVQQARAGAPTLAV